MAGDLRWGSGQVDMGGDEQKEEPKGGRETMAFKQLLFYTRKTITGKHLQDV